MFLGGLVPGVAALALLWAARPGGTVLDWRFDKGKPFFEETTIHTQQRSQFLGATMDEDHAETFYFLSTPKEQDALGNWIIDRRLRRIVVKMHPGEREVVFDSADTSQGRTEYTDFFKIAVGMKATMLVGRNMKIIDLELPRTINPGNNRLLAQHFADNAPKQMAEHLFRWLPPRAVRPGDSWDDAIELVLGPMGGFQASCRFTYEGIVDQLDQVRLAMTLKYLPPVEKKGGTLFLVKKGELLADRPGSGLARFDRKRGRLDRAEWEFKVKGKLLVEVPGIESELDLDNHTRMVVKVWDVPAGK
jgi:hypothetical protein